MLDPRRRGPAQRCAFSRDAARARAQTRPRARAGVEHALAKVEAAHPDAPLPAAAGAGTKRLGDACSVRDAWARACSGFSSRNFGDVRVRTGRELPPQAIFVDRKTFFAYFNAFDFMLPEGGFALLPVQEFNR